MFGIMDANSRILKKFERSLGMKITHCSEEVWHMQTGIKRDECAELCNTFSASMNYQHVSATKICTVYDGHITTISQFFNLFSIIVQYTACVEDRQICGRKAKIIYNALKSKRKLNTGEYIGDMLYSANDQILNKYVSRSK